MYDTIFQICMGLTNIHISWHCLRDGDGQHYQQIRNKCFTLGKQVVKRRKLNPARYRAKRKNRIDLDKEQNAYGATQEDSLSRATPGLAF